MAKKAPGLFRKKIRENRLEKQIIKFIAQPDDQEFIRSCYELTDGKWVLKTDLDAKALKKLSSLGKAIKANRKGAVKLIPLVAVSAAVAGIVFFITVLANPFLERTIEGALESLFEARAEIDNFHLSFLKFEIGIDGIAIANRDSPMKNLIETGRMEFKLKPQAILRGKVYIEEIRADSLEFDTPRETSGELPGYPPRSKQEKEAAASPPLIDLANFDAMGLLESEFDKLKTPKLYDEAFTIYNTSVEKWQGEVTKIQARTEEVKTRVQPFINLNVNNLNNLDTITQTIKDALALRDSIQGAVADVTGVVSAVETDIATADRLVRDAANGVTDDLEYLKSFLDLGSGTALAVLEPAIKDILSEQAEQYIAYGQQALEIFNKLKAGESQQLAREVLLDKTGQYGEYGLYAFDSFNKFQAAQAAKAPAKPKAERFKGRNVVYPTQAYPKFFLGVLASDFTAGNWHYGIDLRGISSNPDLTDNTTNLKLNLAEPDGAKREFAFVGSADFRSSAVQLFDTEVSAQNIGVHLTNNIEQLGIGGFSGNSAFSLAFAGTAAGAVTGSGNIAVRQAEIENPSGTIAEAIADAVHEVDALTLGLRYTYNPASRDEFGVSTNIGELVLNALKRLATEYAQRAAAELERVLKEKIAAYIDGRFVSAQDLDNIARLIKGDKSAMDDIKASLDKKITELEARAIAYGKEVANEKINEVKAIAEEKINEVVPAQAQDAVKGITDGLRGRLPF
jgi:uncharacterized protein (TIGR03545 family)